MRLSKIKKFKPSSAYSKKGIAFFACAFALIGVATLLLTRAATPGIAVTVDSTLPNVTNLQIIPDDRVATVMWSAPSNASSKQIVGYYVTWGTQASGTFTQTKQTTYNITQIQPLTNGTVYNVKVQAVQGSTTQVPVPTTINGGSASEALANGKVSTGVTTTVTPSSNRVDALRQQMTGFFDDFNLPAGGMDELKWNNATSACANIGSSGAFINNQFHTHTQVRSSNGKYVELCDRSQNVARARSVFDISGRTEANPGVIVGDFDGVTNDASRDIFYIDIIPLSARPGGVPIDVTGHSSVDEGEPADPSMLRFSQSGIDGESAAIFYSGANKGSTEIKYSYRNCPPLSAEDAANPDKFHGVIFGQCPVDPTPAITGNYQEIPLTRGSIFPTPNVRQHIRLELSSAKIKFYLNGVRMLEGPMPAEFTNITQWTVESNLFSYNTGKDSSRDKPNTTLLHWDNFGFNGPAPTTVVHSYQEGGPTGNTPYLGTGTVANQLPLGSRTTKIPIPDPIGLPQAARIMFTNGALNFNDYSWRSTDSVTINGHKYSVPDQRNLESGVFVGGGGHHNPFATFINISPGDLIQGTNSVTLSMNNGDVFNVHIELVYAKGSEPAYTQPGVIFGAANYLSFIQPPIDKHDNYLYVEQDMGLPSSTTETPPPPQPPTPPPTPPTVPPAPPTPPTVPPPPGKTGDINGDGSVGIADLAILLGNYNKQVPINTKGDLNSSSTVTTADLAILLGNYGK